MIQDNYEAFKIATISRLEDLEKPEFDFLDDNSRRRLVAILLKHSMMKKSSRLGKLWNFLKGN
jgi:hypothetical protein